MRPTRKFYCAKCNMLIPEELVSNDTHRIVQMYGPDLVHAVVPFDGENGEIANETWPAR